MKGSVKSISNHPRRSSPYKNDRFTGSYDIRLTLTIAPALQLGVHLDTPLVVWHWVLLTIGYWFWRLGLIYWLCTIELVLVFLSRLFADLLWT